MFILLQIMLGLVRISWFYYRYCGVCYRSFDNVVFVTDNVGFVAFNFVFVTADVVFVTDNVGVC